MLRIKIIIVLSLEIQVAKATNGQKNGSAEESTPERKLNEKIVTYWVDKNLKMGPWADKKIWKTRPRSDKKFEKWGLKSVGPPSLSLRGDPPGAGQKLPAWKSDKFCFVGMQNGRGGWYWEGAENFQSAQNK